MKYSARGMRKIGKMNQVIIICSPEEMRSPAKMNFGAYGTNENWVKYQIKKMIGATIILGIE